MRELSGRMDAGVDKDAGTMRWACAKPGCRSQ